MSSYFSSSGRMRTPLRAVAVATAAAVSWLVTSPAIAATTVKPPRPRGHARTLSATEMARIVGSQGTHVGGILASPSSGSPQPWEGQFGDVASGTGNKLTRHGIVSWTQRGGLPVALSLSHSSIGSTNNTIGKKWTHSYNVYLSSGTNPGDLQFVDGSGRGINFIANINGSYSAPVGIYDTLVLNSNGTYTLTRKGGGGNDAGEIWTFNSSKWLTSIADRNGNTITLAYDSSDRLQTVTDFTSRQITFTWDTTNNRITQITDPLSRQWDLSYDSSGNLTQVQDPALSGTVHYNTGFSYDSNSCITQITDRRGKAWTFHYDSSNRLTWEKTPLLHQTSYSYGTGSTTITDPRSNTVVHTFDSAGNLASVTDEASYTEGYTYDTSHNRTGITDRRSKAWAYTYDTRGNVLTKTDPLSHTTTYTYNNFDELLTVTTDLGHVTTTAYDILGNRTSVTDPLSHATTYTINSYGQVTQVTDATSRQVTIAYDANGYPNSLTNSAGITSSAYDALGRITSVTDATSRVTSTAYDAMGRTTSVTAPGSRTTSLTYDAEGNKLTQTNNLSQTDTFAYDDDGRLTSHTDALSHAVSFAYDNNNNKTGFTDGNSHTTTYSYTARNELSGISYPDSTSESWTYLATGQMLNHTDGRSLTVTDSYDNAGRLTGIDYPTGTADVSFGYDTDNRRTSMGDGTGSTTWTYDNASRMTGRSTPQGSVALSYDNANRLSLRAVTGAGTESYTYNTAGRLQSVGMDIGTTSYGTTSYTYDAAGRITQVTNPNSTVEARTYDSTTGDLDEVVHSTSTSTVLLSNTYTHDAIGRIAQMVMVAPNMGGYPATINYSYDGAGHLTGESRQYLTVGNTDTDYAIGYTYDNSGNRLTKTLDGVTESYTYDDANKLLTAGDRGYTYDDAGNVTEITSTSATTTLTWDAASRLASETSPGTGGASVAHQYNGLGQMVGWSTGSYSGSYTLTDDSIDAKVLSDGSSTYLYGQGVAGEVRPDEGFRGYHADALGTYRLVTDNTGYQTSNLDTDAFGNLWLPGSEGEYGYDGSIYGFAGMHGYQGGGGDFMRLGHRYYDPSIGRFLSRDPVQDGNNWYAYCGDDPVNAVDPEGLSVPDDHYLQDPSGVGVGDPHHRLYSDYAAPPQFVIDINVNFGGIVGVTGGLLLDSNNGVYWYDGIFYGTPGGGGGIYISPGGSASEGNGTSIGGAIGIGGSGGSDDNGNFSGEIGIGTKGISISRVKVHKMP